MATQSFVPRPCSKCGTVFDESGYRPNPRYRDGYTRQCRDCTITASNAARARRQADRGGDWRTLYDMDARHAYYRAHRAAKPEQYRDAMRKHRYGLTSDQYEALVDESGGLCAICRKTMGRVCVDHDHETGRVRGLLCHNCNVGLGLLGDDPIRLQAALNYLGG